jgi:hypothetical protein
MKKILKITESQYNRIFLNEEVLRETESLLNEQSNTPKEYGCIVEKYGDKGKVIQFDKRKSYLIRNNNNDRLYFLEDKSFFHIKKGQGWKTEGQYSCADKKYKIKDKEGDLFTYIDNFLKAPTGLPEPAPSDDSDDADYSGCVKGTYLEGVIKSIKQTPITGLERKDKLTLQKPPKEPGNLCRICYQNSNKGITTNICFYSDGIYFLESTTKDDILKFKPHPQLLSLFGLPEDLETSYISYLGAWDTDDNFVGEIQNILLKIGRIKLQYTRENNQYKKHSGNMKNLSGSKGLFTYLINFLFGNTLIKPTGKIELEKHEENFYNTIYNELEKNDEEGLVKSLNNIIGVFDNYNDFNRFETKVNLSGRDSITKVIMDKTSWVDLDWVNIYKPKLRKILTNKTPWSNLSSYITEIEEYFKI